MSDLVNQNPEFNSNPFWSTPIPEDKIDHDLIESNKCVYLFDQNGYDLCPLEIEYSKFNLENSDVNMDGNSLNSLPLFMHRNEKHYSLQKPWYTQKEKFSGYVLNHSMILERKAYSGEALQQLLKFAKRNPLIYKVINIQSKWGIDFSLDFIGTPPQFESPEVCEIFHFEWDGFSYEQANNMKSKVENVINNLNFEEVSLDLIKRKNEWQNLEFFEQSDWKCRYFGLPSERFKLVTWYGE